MYIFIDAYTWYPWKRAWQPAPVFLPGESPWTEELCGLQSMESQRVRHDWVTKNAHRWYKLGDMVKVEEKTGMTKFFSTNNSMEFIFTFFYVYKSLCVWLWCLSVLKRKFTAFVSLLYMRLGVKHTTYTTSLIFRTNLWDEHYNPYFIEE